MNPTDDERDPGLDPQIEELLAGYREFLDEPDPSAQMPDDVTSRIREAIAHEKTPEVAPRPRQRSMFALAASVALIGAGLGATVLVTSQGGPGSDPAPIRAGATDEQVVGGQLPLPSQDFAIELPGENDDEAAVIVPANGAAQTEVPVVFVLDGESSAAADIAASTCAEDDVCVAVIIPSFESIQDPADRAAAQLEAVEASKTALTSYAGLEDSWLVYGDLDPSEPVLVAGIQRGLFQQLEDLQSLE